MKTLFRKQLTSLLLCFTASALIFGQDTLPVIKPADYSKWQNLGVFSVSDNGNWISWTVSTNDKDDTLFVRNPGTSKSYTFPLCSGLVFSSDSKWALFRIGLSQNQIEKLNEQKKPVRYKAMLVNLSNGQERIFDNISSFSFTRDSKHALLSGYPPENSKTRDLFIYHLANGTIKNIGNVIEYAVNKHGSRLAFIISAENKKGNGVELLNLDNYGLTFLDNDTCIYRNLVWEREGNSLAFLKVYNDTAYVEDNHILFIVRNINIKPEIKSYNPAADKSFPEGMRISENYRPVISDDQNIIYFGGYSWTAKEKKDKKNGGEEKIPGVDVWHWKDDPIQPRQKNTYETDKNFSFIFAWIPGMNKTTRITDEDMREAIISNGGKYAVARNRKNYTPAFREQYYDHYAVNAVTGEKKELLKKFPLLNGISPAGKYALYFKDKNWWIYDFAKDAHINLTEDIPVDFWNTRDDSPRDVKPPFGTGGWFKDDQALLVYDEFDVWKLTSGGTKPARLTNGREQGIIFRFEKLSYEYPYIEPNTDLYFSAFGDTNKYMGYYRLTSKNRFEKLIFENKAVSGLRKADKAEIFAFRSETYSVSPDVYRTDYSFAAPGKISSTNPQQGCYAWGKSELVHFRNRDGKPLQGTLFYPANYVPGRKYPMIVYIYEIRSYVLNRYVVPSLRSPYNTTNYTSQGFFVFQPDIVYMTNNPGKSAVDCVVPAVEEVLKTGMIDEKKIGIMGHSWGAYQTSFIITQTKLFSAAVAGAPLIDMISMYNEIYWNSGNPNQNIFEVSQGRLREPWWVILKEYMDNSPMFQAQNIVTPLLVTFGTSDGAVDWHQGIEMFTTMRRMEKPFIMLVYEGENHSLAKKENQIDYTKKVNEFFNHYLLGSDPPEWISKGRSYLDKKKEEEAKAVKK